MKIHEVSENCVGDGMVWCENERYILHWMPRFRFLDRALHVKKFSHAVGDSVPTSSGNLILLCDRLEGEGILLPICHLIIISSDISGYFSTSLKQF